MPMKLRPEACRIMPEMLLVVWMMMGPMALGRMWRMMMRESSVPQARAASTKSDSTTVSTVERISRTKPGMLETVMATSRFTMLAPRAATMARASRVPGMAVKMSMIRMMISSTRPP